MEFKGIDANMPLRHPTEDDEIFRRELDMVSAPKEDSDLFLIGLVQ
jgi:hypothetical protein